MGGGGVSIANDAHAVLYLVPSVPTEAGETKLACLQGRCRDSSQRLRRDCGKDEGHDHQGRREHLSQVPRLVKIFILHLAAKEAELSRTSNL
jgi:hypothetical protein